MAMPTKRRKTGVLPIGGMTMNQRDHLECGCYFWTNRIGQTGIGGAEFEDEAHRRAAWEAHREVILYDWSSPGRRPFAFWEYEYGLQERPNSYRGWFWPKPITSEAEMVHHLLTIGEIAGCHFNGVNRIADELAQIEADWLQEISGRVSYTASPPAPIRRPLDPYGTPPWFFKAHAKRIWAEAGPWPRKLPAAG
jgi:hypothetical protein